MDFPHIHRQATVYCTCCVTYYKNKDTEKATSHVDINYGGTWMPLECIRKYFKLMLQEVEADVLSTRPQWVSQGPGFETKQ